MTIEGLPEGLAVVKYGTLYVGDEQDQFALSDDRIARFAVPWTGLIVKAIPGYVIEFNSNIGKWVTTKKIDPPLQATVEVSNENQREKLREFCAYINVKLSGV